MADHVETFIASLKHAEPAVTGFGRVHLTGGVNPSLPRALVVAKSVESECEELGAELNSYSRLDEGVMSAILRAVGRVSLVTKGCH